MRGDDDFEDFFQASYPHLVGQLTVLTGSLDDAEDAVQEAFARASTRRARLRAYDAPEAWVRRVALNLATSALRRTRRQLAALARLGTATATWPAPARCAGSRCSSPRRQHRARRHLVSRAQLALAVVDAPCQRPGETTVCASYAETTWVGG
jgi:DNA-directed RNA polymerase specialized sigma24 family protein